MDSNGVYVVLGLLGGLALFLNIQWLFLAAVFLFVAVIFSQLYSSLFPASTASPQQLEALSSPAPSSNVPSASSAASSQQQPVIVVTGGGEGIGLGGHYFATMLGTFSALDAYEKKTQAPWHQFLSRGSQMRQNMFSDSGTVGTRHQAMKRDISNERLDVLAKRLDKLTKAIEKKGV